MSKFYTSVTSFNSNNPSAGTVPYEGKSSNASEVDKEKEEKFELNKVRNVNGSVSGAGSGEFHKYRTARRK